VDRLPDLTDIAAAMAIVHYSIKATKWALTKYQEKRVNSPAPVLLSGEVSGSFGMEGTLTVGSERQILYNVEAPTPSFARRLEDLAAWYLHVS
jgi:hypothetical protein